MTRIILLTQGGLAEELVRGVRTIAGGADRIEVLSLDWDESPEESERRLGALLDEDPTGDGDGILMLTDLPGGTPFNVASRFVRPGEIEVLSGVNLAMLVRLCCPGCEERSAGTLAAWIQEKGRKSIRRAEAAATAERGSAGG